MGNSKDVDKLKRRYERLAQRLSKVGPVLQGSISERYIEREKDGQTVTIGPYYQWTFKQKGKTKTVNLSATQSKRFQKAIDNNRALEQMLKEMRELSREILEATTKGVVKRNSR